MIRFILLALFFCAIALRVSATTYTAASADYSDVLEKYNLCAEGDTLAIPAGTAFWKDGSLLSASQNIIIQGAGVGQTIIYSYKTTTPYALFGITTNAGKVQRLSGIEFRGQNRAGVTASASTNVFTLTNHQFAVGNRIQFSSATTYTKVPIVGGAPVVGVNQLSSSSVNLYYVKTTPTADTFTISTTNGGAELDITTNMTSGAVGLYLADDSNQSMFSVAGFGTLRVDHCAFYEVYTGQIFKWRNAYGVIDHCEFQLSLENSRAVMLAYKDSPSGGGKDWGDYDWERATNFGSSEALYIEDCTINKAGTAVYGFIDSINGGGRAVIRNNTLTKTRAGYHGTETSTRYRSGRKMEFYRNTLDVTGISGQSAYGVDIRGGAFIGFDNKFTGDIGSCVSYENYRLSSPLLPWLLADGTKAWDIADTSDGAGTPGPLGVGTGAGDGVFEAGTATTGASNTVTDSGKAWGLNVWTGYTVRQVHPITAVSGGVRTLTVSGTPWPGISWVGWELTRTSDNAKGFVVSNTDSTLTLSTSYYALDCTGGGSFVLSYAGIISGNTATTLTTSNTYNANARVFKTGYVFEIRKVAAIIDGTGMSLSTAINTNGSTPNHQSLGQTRTDPAYTWMNLIRANSGIAWASATKGGVNLELPITANIDSFDAVSKDAQTTTSSPFNGSTGVGYGTIANRPASASLAGVGYWATDEGEWDSTNGTTPDGQLYTWTGSAWTIKYTPYTYPHPLVEAPPAATRIPGRRAGIIRMRR